MGPLLDRSVLQSCMFNNEDFVLKSLDLKIEDVGTSRHQDALKQRVYVTPMLQWQKTLSSISGRSSYLMEQKAPKNLLARANLAIMGMYTSCLPHNVKVEAYWKLMLPDMDIKPEDLISGTFRDQAIKYIEAEKPYYIDTLFRYDLETLVYWIKEIINFSRFEVVEEQLFLKCFKFEFTAELLPTKDAKAKLQKKEGKISIDTPLLEKPREKLGIEEKFRAKFHPFKEFDHSRSIASVVVIGTTEIQDIKILLREPESGDAYAKFLKTPSAIALQKSQKEAKLPYEGHSPLSPKAIEVRNQFREGSNIRTRIEGYLKAFLNIALQIEAATIIQATARMDDVEVMNFRQQNQLDQQVPEPIDDSREDDAF